MGLWRCLGGTNEIGDRRAAAPAGFRPETGCGPSLIFVASGFEGINDTQIAHDQGTGQHQRHRREPHHPGPASCDVGRGGIFDGGVGALRRGASGIGAAVCG